jgi:two-component system aerobic respiration control sensor histidine kinase ArcB
MIRILFVEDDEISRKLGVKILENSGKVETTAAKNGYEALALYQHNYFDLLLVDLSLPDISGLDVVSLIKHKYKTRPPAVAISAHLGKNEKTPSTVDRLYAKPLTSSLFEEILTLLN